MSEYIYGSSLRAAKSKANYLFEGDFRRRPNQNLSGASRSVARLDLLRQAAEQRQTREDIRHKEIASTKIQSTWRAYKCRKSLATSMRAMFDNSTRDLPQLTTAQFEQISREFLLFYNSGKDEHRFARFIDLMTHSWQPVLDSKRANRGLWLFRIGKLLRINMSYIERTPSAERHLKFLEHFTRPSDILDKTDNCYVWPTLTRHRLYPVMRKVGQFRELDKFLIELLRRSLDIEQPNPAQPPACTFFDQFLVPETLNANDTTPLPEVRHLSELLRLEPLQLRPSCILQSFAGAHLKTRVANNLNMSDNTSSANMEESRRIIWLCYLFVRALHSRVGDFDDTQKVEYINIIATLVGPAEHLTNILALARAQEDACEDSCVEADNDSELGSVASPADKQQTTRSHHPSDTTTHQLIRKLIELLNQLDHINGLKAIIFSEQHQGQVQGAIVRICSLMLAHEYLAIFNCRLLYTVAFSKEFSRSLWRSILAASASSLYGNNGAHLHQLIARGSQSMISYDSWKSILPRLRLFCSLCSYLLPTLDDEEFYTNEVNPLFSEDQAGLTNQQSTQATSNTHTHTSATSGATETSTSIASFYVDRELVGISATLRDLCVGLVEILYQSYCRSAATAAQRASASMGFGNASSTSYELSPQDDRARLLAFEIKSSFQALVRLVNQLHARDSRKRFCPNGHWICPSIMVPASKAVDFQMATSERGRMLDQITRPSSGNSSGSSSSNVGAPHLSADKSISSEIKTVLILQEIPFVISFHDRVQIFQQLLRKERQIHQTDGYHFGLPGTAILINVRRNYIYEDAFEKLSLDNERNMKLPLKVSLVNAAGAHEAGIDGGGLTKEFLDELLKAGFDPMRGFFKYTKDHSLYPNPSANVLFSTLSEGYEVHYEFLGRILGKAIFEKTMVELPLASFFLAKLLAVKHSSDVDLHNLESLDPVLYKNLVYLKNYKGDVADLNLDFTISNNELDEHEVLELKPGGSKIPVTRDNKIEYVHLVADYRLNKQIRLQCAAFKRGLAQLVDLDWLRMFDPRELQILISGAPTEIDVGDWRRNTIYGSGYTDTSKVIETFWQVVERFSESQKRKLLKFATSCSLPPLLGFKDLVPQFAIAPAEEERLPTASTCMNLLKLPQCEEASTMRQKLLYAVESNSGFELS